MYKSQDCQGKGHHFPICVFIQKYPWQNTPNLQNYLC